MSGQDAGRPLLRIVHGTPDEAEVAALVMALAAAGGVGGEPAPAPPPARNWGAPRTLVRVPVAPDGWWPSGLAR